MGGNAKYKLLFHFAKEREIKERSWRQAVLKTTAQISYKCNKEGCWSGNNV